MSVQSATALAGRRVVLNDSATEFEIRSSAGRLLGLIFVPVPEPGDPRTGCIWISSAPGLV
jgi:hypothetical protein